MVNKVLIIEDNHSLRRMLRNFLEINGYIVYEAETGEEGLRLFQEEAITIVLLDIMLPGIDGFEVCQAIRQYSVVPIIMMTAKSEDHDKILGLDVGADDYIVKPFSHEEMLARMRAIMRRVDVADIKRDRFDLLYIDTEANQVNLDKEPTHLTMKEYDLLEHFTRHPNQLFSRIQLLDVIWGMDYDGDARTVDSHIKRLREKLKTDKKVNWSIKTVWGKGYMFEVEQ